VARTFQTPRIDFQTTGRDAVRCGLYPQSETGPGLAPGPCRRRYARSVNCRPVPMWSSGGWKWTPGHGSR
jgi:hypothetical protein